MSETQISSADIEKYMYLVKRIAWNLKKRLPSSVYMDDLIQCGCIGLMKAFKKYDPSQGASFETYAGIRIRGEILDELRRNNTQPKGIMIKAKKLKNAIHNVEARIRRKATQEEVAKELDISVSELNKTQAASIRNLEIFYDNHNKTDFKMEDITPGDAKLEHFMDPKNILERDELLSMLEEACSRTPAKEVLVFELYHEEELSLREIGAILNVSESRISQLLTQAMLKIQGRFNYLYTQ